MKMQVKLDAPVRLSSLWCGGHERRRTVPTPLGMRGVTAKLDN